jgi:hypothetical protein
MFLDAGLTVAHTEQIIKRRPPPPRGCKRSASARRKPASPIIT